MHLNAIIWGIDPEIFPLGPFSIRYYGLLFAMAFYFGYVIINRFFRKEKIASSLLDKLLLYVAIGTIAGARLGHVLFYQPDYYLNNPLEILQVWHGGLASHGAAIGILIALYLFCRKTKSRYLWIIDRVVIVVALSGFFIRMGNFMNSEIYGEPTNSKQGVIFSRHLKEGILQNNHALEKVSFSSGQTGDLVQGKYVPVQLHLEFTRVNITEDSLKDYLENNIKNAIVNNGYSKENNFFQDPGVPLKYEIKKERGKYYATVHILGIPHHPTQIYEALSYVLIFLLLLYIYYKRFGRLAEGIIFAWFLILLFSARFLIEFIKEEQVEFEKTMTLNMGQWLSIPFILLGIVLWIVFQRRGIKNSSV